MFISRAKVLMLKIGWMNQIRPFRKKQDPDLIFEKNPGLIQLNFFISIEKSIEYYQDKSRHCNGSGWSWPGSDREDETGSWSDSKKNRIRKTAENRSVFDSCPAIRGVPLCLIFEDQYKNLTQYIGFPVGMEKINHSHWYRAVCWF